MKMRRKMVVLTLALAAAWSGLELYSGNDAQARVCFLVGGCKDPKTGKLEKVPTTGTETGGTTIGINDKDCLTLGYVQCEKNGKIPDPLAQSCTKNGEIWYSACLCDTNIYKYLDGDGIGDYTCHRSYPGGPIYVPPRRPYTCYARQYDGAGSSCTDSQGKHYQYKVCHADYSIIENASLFSLLNPYHNTTGARVGCTSPNAVPSGDACQEMYDLKEGTPATYNRYEYCECPEQYKYNSRDIPVGKENVFELSGSTCTTDNLEWYNDVTFATSRKCSGKAEGGGFWKDECETSTERSFKTETWSSYDGDLTCHLCIPDCDASVFPYTYGDDMGGEQSTRPGAILQSPAERAKKYTGAGRSCTDDNGEHFERKICKARYKYMVDPEDAEAEQRIYRAFAATHYNFPTLCSPSAIDLESGYCDEVGMSLSSPQPRKYVSCECGDQFQYDLGGALPRSHGASYCRIGSEYKYESNYATCSATSEPAEEYIAAHAGRSGTWWDTCNRGRWGTHFSVESITFGGETCNLCVPYCDTSVYKYADGDTGDGMYQLVSNRDVCQDPDGLHRKYRVCSSEYKYIISSGNRITDNRIIDAIRDIYSAKEIEICPVGSAGSEEYCDNEIAEGNTVRLYKGCGCDTSVYKYMYGDDMGSEQSTMPGAMQQSPIERAKKYTGAGETCTDSAGTHYQYKICKARYDYVVDPGSASQLNNIRNALNTGAHHEVGTWCVYGSSGNYDYCDDKYDLNTQTGTSSVRRYTDCVEPSYYGS